MATTEQYQNVKDQANTLLSSVNELQNRLSLVSPPEDVSEAVQALLTNIQYVVSWTDAQMSQTPPQELTVIEQFLAELKVVFEKYSAILTVVGQDGGGYGIQYGESYGESGTAGATGIKLTATLNGVTESKTYSKTTLTKDDLL